MSGDGETEVPALSDIQALIDHFEVEDADDVAGIVGEEIDRDVYLFIDEEDPDRPWVLAERLVVGGSIGV